MNTLRPKVREVEALEEYKLRLTFENGEERIFSVKPYMKNFFSELEDRSYFERVSVENGSIRWPHGQDLAYDMLYYKSDPLSVAD